MLDQRLGYVLLAIGVAIICFWLYVSELNKRLAEQQENDGLPKQEYLNKRRDQARKYWLIGAIGLVWLTFTVFAIGGDGVCLTISLLSSAIILFGVGCLVYGKFDEGHFIALKFLLTALGFGFGLALGLSLFRGALAFVTALICAALFPIGIHELHKRAVCDFDPDEEKEYGPTPAVPIRPAQATRPNTQPTTAQPPRTYYRPAYRPAYRPVTTTNQPVHRRTVPAQAPADQNSDWQLNAFIVEQLSKTKEGRQYLVEVLKKTQN